MTSPHLDGGSSGICSGESWDLGLSEVVSGAILVGIWNSESWSVFRHNIFRLSIELQPTGQLIREILDHL